MGVLTSPLCCAVKCCGCIILSQLIGLLLSIGSLVLFVAVFYFYILPWGERQIVSELGLPDGTDFDSISASTFAAQNCSGCVFGTNTDWPTTTTGTLHFLDTAAGSTISSVVATTLVATAAAGAGTMLWASLVPSMASAMSFAGGFYEMTHILEQAQYIGMIGQLQLKGAPEFLNQFSKELAWTNFNLPTSVTDKILPSRRLDLTDTVADTASAAVQPKYDGETGPAKYAKTLGVDAKDLFFYTLKVFAAVVVVIHALYIVWVLIMSCVNKKLSFGEVAAQWYRKVVWAVLLALLLAQYIFAMTGSYFIYENMRSDEPKDSQFTLACVLLAAAVGFAIIFGIAIIANNTDELKDIGTVDHDDRPFAAKYSAYYDEYNFDNRFFFVPRILLAVATGVVVGVVQDPTKQLFFVLGLTFLYLLLIILREPNLLRFLYYIGLTSVFMKVVLVCMMLVLVQDDFFPQNVRDKVAYAIIGINIFIFFLLFLRQAYIIIYKIVRGCKNKGKDNDDDDDDDARRHAIEEANRGARYERLNSIGGARGTRTGGHANDPYAQSQQVKEQNFMAQQQQQQPYGRSDGSIQGAAAGAAAGYAANGRYAQQQQHQQPASQADMYGQQAGGRGAGMDQGSYGADPRQNGGSQYRYGSGAEPGYDAQGGRGSAQNSYGGSNANGGRPQGRSIADRYLGVEGGGTSAAVGTGAAVGATAYAQSSQQENAPSGAMGAGKPEPEKYTWRRNMERRAAETAAAEEAARPPPPQRNSLLRFDSDDSYGTESRAADSGRGLNSSAAYGGDSVAHRSSSPRQRQLQETYATGSSDDWFNQRAPSDVGSYASGATFSRSDGLAASSLAAGSSYGGDDVNSSFMSADSYSSSRQGTMMDSQRSLNSALDDTARTGVTRVNTQNLDNLAVAYLEKAGGAGAVENDIGDDDDDDDEGVAPLLDFPKVADKDDDNDDSESVDIDADPDSDDDDDDDDVKKAGDKDIDVDDDDEDIDRESVDIDDESDGDVDIDAISSHDKNDFAGTFLSEASADRDSYSNIKQLDDIRDSYMSDSSVGYGRQMSDVSLRSDDDASFYLEGRRVDSPSAADRQMEREKTSGPLKL